MLFDIHSGCFGRFIRLVTSGKCLSIILVKVEIKLCRYGSIEMFSAPLVNQGAFCKSYKNVAELKLLYFRYVMVLWRPSFLL